MKKKVQLTLLSALSVLASNDAATQFSLPRGQSKISCTDDLSNVCTAPTSCNKNGRVNFVAGDNFEPGQVTQQNGYWYIVGGYNISFPSECEVICQGSCTCENCTSTSEANDFVTADTPGVVLESLPPSSASTVGASGIMLISSVLAYFLH